MNNKCTKNIYIYKCLTYGFGGCVKRNKTNLTFINKDIVIQKNIKITTDVSVSTRRHWSDEFPRRLCDPLPPVTAVLYYRWLAAGLHDKIISRGVGCHRVYVGIRHPRHCQITVVKIWSTYTYVLVDVLLCSAEYFYELYRILTSP